MNSPLAEEGREKSRIRLDPSFFSVMLLIPLMYLELKYVFTAGQITIEPGRYLVSAEPDMARIRLSGRGYNHYLPAQSRPAKRKVRVTELSFQPALSGDQHLILVRVPPQREWFVLLTRSRQREARKPTV